MNWQPFMNKVLRNLFNLLRYNNERILLSKK